MSPSDSSIIPRRSLQSEVVTRLRDEIIAGKLAPGTRLQEQALCNRFGISRSPLREAFNVLAGEDLIALLPNKGAIVTAPTLESAEQHFDLVSMLECRCIELACTRATDEQIEEIVKLHERMRKTSDGDGGSGKAYIELNNRLHRAIVLAANNEVLARHHQMAVRQMIRIQNLYGLKGETPKDSGVEHDKFVRALVKRDAVKAVAELRKHLGTADRMLHTRLKNTFE